ncbi:MAG: DUF3793 family protein [Treponema sp.]|nr:DUF3793 family protein [Treponema sp.]
MSIESFLIWRCAPVLAGIKPASLVSISLKEYPEAEKEIKLIAKANLTTGLSFLSLCRCSERILVYVYRRNLLLTALAAAGVKEYLDDAGYEKCICIEQKLSLLEQKLVNDRKKFPHEIGIFLGYPLEDVKGFTKYSGRNAKYCGYWKVYGNEQKAKLLFREYEKCFIRSHSLACLGVSFAEALESLSA